MDIKRLRYFCTIVEQGQISRAAQVLHMSQPPLSQRLQELENEVGAQLIIRNGGNWQVTKEGEFLYQKAQAVLSHMDALADEVRQVGKSVKGLVRIGVAPPNLPTIQGALPIIHEAYPELRFRIFVSGNPALEEQIRQRLLDFALVFLPIADAHVEVTSLPVQEYMAVYGEGLIPPDTERIGVAELASVPLMLLRREDGGGGYELLKRTFQEQGLRPDIMIDSPDSRIIVSLMERGMSAVALLPASEISSLQLAQYPTRRVDIPGFRIHPVIIRLRDTYIPSHVQVALSQLLVYSGASLL